LPRQIDPAARHSKSTAWGAAWPGTFARVRTKQALNFHSYVALSGPKYFYQGNLYRTGKNITSYSKFAAINGAIKEMH
jgi:hypothetical protein